MRRCAGASRWLLPWMALVPLLSACQSIRPDSSIPPESSLLAVDVRYPTPLRRDPDLVQAFFVKGSLPAESDELPELIPATFVKSSRAYLLDPAPGTYFLAAVTSAVAAPLDDYPVAGGVTHSTLPGTIANAVILPAERIERTRTAIAPGGVAFMGVLRVRPGERIHANAAFQDDLQQRIAERVHPGATSKSGVAGWFTRTWTVDREKTSLSNGPADREAFFDDAREDLGVSPWAQFVARAAPRPETAARTRPPGPGPKRAAAAPRAVAPRAPSAAPEPTAAAPPSQRAAPEPEAVAPEPEGAAPQPAIAEPEPEAATAETETAARALENSTAETEAAARDLESATPEPVTTAPEPKIATQELAIAEPETATAETEADALEPESATPQPEASPAVPERRRFPGVPPHSPLAQIESGMGFDEVRAILGDPDDRINRQTAKAWIPFYTGHGAYLREWIYEGEGRVVFSLYRGSLEVIDVVYDPDQGR